MLTWRWYTLNFHKVHSLQVERWTKEKVTMVSIAAVMVKTVSVSTRSHRTFRPYEGKKRSRRNSKTRVRRRQITNLATKCYHPRTRAFNKSLRPLNPLVGSWALGKNARLSFRFLVTILRARPRSQYSGRLVDLCCITAPFENYGHDLTAFL